MPIRAENKARYPKDWKAISLRIRERAGQKCEKCNAPNGELIFRFSSEDYHFEPSYMTDEGEVFHAETGNHLDDVPPCLVTDATDGKWVRVVLTVAHLDHIPENCADDNLRAWCQRCHNIYDAPMRKAGIKERRKSSKAISDLFGDA